MNRVKIANPKTWVAFTPNLCKTCWASCCHDMPVEASVPDLIRMGYLTEEEASRSLAPAAKRLKKAGIIRTFRPRSLIFVLAQKPNRDCIFLNEARRCTIYKKRPEICRQFPKIGPNPGHCPYLPK